MIKRLGDLTVEDKARAFDFMVDQLKKCDCPGRVISHANKYKGLDRVEKVLVYEWYIRSNGEPNILVALLANVGIEVLP